ncbi:MAG: hypothetical protein E4H00_06150 [Myxococcales bacterium]|nr:MAG: hypothetical protein E4H00_06150 [Myxococcales bacterium]
MRRGVQPGDLNALMLALAVGVWMVWMAVLMVGALIEGVSEVSPGWGSSTGSSTESCYTSEERRERIANGQDLTNPDRGACHEDGSAP